LQDFLQAHRSFLGAVFVIIHEILMSKGRRKFSLRDYSRLLLSTEDRAALLQAATATEQHSMVIAVLNAIVLEHELESLLRRRLSKRDDQTWKRLLDDHGPLSSFHQKIELAHALGTIDERTRKDLAIVKTIRNAFAHSKKVIDFHDSLIISELLSVSVLSKGNKRTLVEQPERSAKLCYLIACLIYANKLSRKHTKALKASNRRRSRKPGSYANALLAFLAPGQGLAPPATNLLSLAQLSPAGRSAGPILSTQPQSLGEQLQRLSKSNDKTGK
jgi:DNA-binding MltR family transcriptional regulator